MPTVLEPIGAGIAVALFNRFVLSGWLWQQCTSGSGTTTTQRQDEDENCTSSSSTTTIDTVEVHHAHMF